METTDTITLKISVRDDGSVVIHNFKDKVQQAFKGVEEGAKGASNTMLDFMKNTVKFTVGFQGVTALLSKGRQALGDIMRGVMDFDYAWQDVTTLVDDSDRVLAGMDQRILDMAGPLGNATELTRAYWLAISSGVDASKGLYAVEQAAKAAKGGQAELNTTLDVGTTVINAYGMKVEDLPHVYDILFEANKRAKTSIDLLSRSYGDVVGTFAVVGGSFEELNASVVSLTLGGVKTSQAMTSMKAVISNIAKPTKEASDTADRLGLKFDIAALKSKGWAGFLQELTEKVQGDAQAQADLFGSVDAFNAIAVMTSKQGIKRYTDALEGMGTATGNTQKAFDKQMESFRNQWQTLRNEVQVIFISHLLPVIRDAAAWVSKNSKAITDFVKGAIDGFKKVAGFVWQFKDVVVLAGKAWLLYFTASKVGAWSNALLGMLPRITAGFTGLIADVTRFKDIFDASKKAGYGFFSSIGHAAEMSGIKTGFLTTKLSGATGVLKSLGPAAIAAFAGWKIGRVINDVLGLGKAVDWLTGKVETYEKWSAMAHMSSEQIATTKKINDVLALARAHGISETNLKKVYLALGQNREAYAKLSPEFKAIVDRFTELNRKQEENLKRNAILTEFAKKYRVEIYEMNRVMLATLGINIPAYFKKTADSAKDAGGSVEKAKDGFQDFADTLGIVTGKGFAELSRETTNLIRATNQYSDQLKQNKELQQSVWEKSTELINKYVQAGKPVPLTLRDIHDSLRDIISDRNALMQKGIFDAMMGGTNPVQMISTIIALTKKYNEELKEAREFAKQHYTIIYEILRIHMLMAGVPMPPLMSPEKLKAATEETKKAKSVFEQMPGILDEIYRTGGQVLDFLSGLGVIGEKTGSALGGLIDGIGGIRSGLDQVLQAKSAGGFLGFLGQVGGYAQVAMAGVRMFIGTMKALTEPNWGARAKKALGGLEGVTADMEKQLADLSEQMGSTEVAYEKMLATFIEGANITSLPGFEKWTAEIEKMMNRLDELTKRYDEFKKLAKDMTKPFADMLAQATDVDSLAKNIEDSFAALVGQAKELGYEGSAAMLKIISQAREMKEEGTTLSSIFKYIDEQYKNYSSALGDYIGAVNDQASFDAAIAHTSDFIALMQSEGKSMMEILDLVGPSLDEIMKKAEAAGYDTSGLSEILGLRKFVTDNKEALCMMDASTKMMQALGNAGVLTQERLNRFQDDLYQTYQKISNGGKDSKKALESLLPSLAQQVWYAKQNNLELSDETKKLLEKAKAQGLNIDGYKSEAQMQAENNKNTESMAKSMEKLVDLLSQGTNLMGTMAQNTADAVKNAAGFSSLNSQDILGGTFGSTRDAQGLPDRGMDFKDKYAGDFAALAALSDSQKNLTKTTQDTAASQSALQSEIVATSAAGKSSLDDLSKTMADTSKKNAAGMNEAVETVISKTTDMAGGFAEVTEEIIATTKAAQRLAAVPPAAIPTIPGVPPPPGIPSPNPPVYAATGFSTMLYKPTAITFDDTRIIAAEAGPELLTIAPVKQTKSTAGSGGGGGDIIIQVSIDNYECKVVVDSDGELDTEEVCDAVQVAAKDNFRGFAENLGAAIARYL